MNKSETYKTMRKAFDKLTNYEKEIKKLEEENRDLKRKLIATANISKCFVQLYNSADEEENNDI